MSISNDDDRSPLSLRACDLDDRQLESRTRDAFDQYRLLLADGPCHPDRRSVELLVELQHEYLRRFPDGDLSAHHAESVSQLLAHLDSGPGMKEASDAPGP